MAISSLSSDVRRLIIKLNYTQGYDGISSSELDKLVLDIQQGVSGFTCTLQSSVCTYPLSESLFKSAVKFWNGDRTAEYCTTASTGSGSLVTPTILIEILTNADSVPSHVLSLIEEKVKKCIVKPSDKGHVIMWVGVTQTNMLAAPHRQPKSTPSSFAVRIKYPQCCAPVKTSTLDTILRGLQQTQDLWTYECTLEASVSSAYCQTAPVYEAGKVKTTADKFLPTIVVEFMCTDPSFNKYKVENSVVDLVKKNIIPTNCTQDVRVKLFHLELGP